MGDGAFITWKKDNCVGRAEFVDGLAAGSAGLACRVVEVGNCDGPDANCGPVETDRRGDGSLFGTDGEAIRGIFDVASSDDSTVCKENGSSNTEFAVRRVSVMSNGGCSLLEIGGYDGVERSGRVGRHEIKAIG